MIIILKIIKSVNSNIYTGNVIEARSPDRVLVKKNVGLLKLLYQKI